MNERNAGLNKSVAEIFDGVSVPGQEMDPGQAKASKKTKNKKPARPKKHLMEHVYARLLGGNGKDVPRKQKVMTFMIPVLLVVLIVMMMKVLDVTSPKSVKAQTKTQFKKIDNLWKLKDWEKPKPLNGDLRDPMRPGQAGQAGSDALVITGIVFSKDDPMAVINGQIVRPGDTVGSAKVLGIGKDFIVFEEKDKRWKQMVQR